MNNIVCNLSALTKEERLEHLKLSINVLSKLTTEKIETTDGYQFFFDDTEENFFQIARWIYFEHKCCSWAVFELATEPSILKLKMKANSVDGKLFFQANLNYISSLKDSQTINEKQISTWQTISKKIGCGC